MLLQCPEHFKQLLLPKGKQSYTSLFWEHSLIRSLPISDFPCFIFCEEVSSVVLRYSILNCLIFLLLPEVVISCQVLGLIMLMYIVFFSTAIVSMHNKLKVQRSNLITK